METVLIILQLAVVLACLLVGAHRGGMGLGLIGGIGLVILVFVFRLPPGEPPIQVMLTILAVIGCASVLQTAGGLDVLMRVAERVLRRHPQHVTILGPMTTWTLTVLCGTGHVVYTMLPIIADIALKKNIRPERPMAISSVAAQMGITASPVGGGRLDGLDPRRTGRSRAGVLHPADPHGLPARLVVRGARRGAVVDPPRQGPRRRPGLPGPHRRPQDA